MDRVYSEYRIKTQNHGEKESMVAQWTLYVAARISKSHKWNNFHSRPVQSFSSLLPWFDLLFSLSLSLSPSLLLLVLLLFLLFVYEFFPNIIVVALVSEYSSSSYSFSFYRMAPFKLYSNKIAYHTTDIPDTQSSCIVFLTIQLQFYCVNIHTRYITFKHPNHRHIFLTSSFRFVFQIKY